MADSIRDRAYTRDRERTEQQPQAATAAPRRRETGFTQSLRAAALRDTSRPSEFQRSVGTEPREEPRGPTTAERVVQGTREQRIGEFQKGIENTTRMMAQSGSAAAAMVLGTLGFEDAAVRVQERSEARDAARGPMHEPRMADFRDIRSATDFGDYMAHLAGSQGPIMSAIIGGALIGGKLAVAGAGARALQASRAAALTQSVRASTPAQRETAQRAAQAISRRLDIRGQAGAALGSVAAITGVTAPGQAELITDEDAGGTVQQRSAGALASSVASGIVGILPVHLFLRSAGFNRRVAHDSARIKNAMGERIRQQSLAARMGKEAGIQAAAAGPVEWGQEMSLRAAHAFFNENVGMFDEEAVGMYLNAAVASTIISGFLGGAGPVIQSAAQSQMLARDNISEFSSDIASRIDAEVKKRIRESIFRNPTKTTPFRKVRAIDEALQTEGESQRLRDELALIVGPEHVDAVLAGARQRDMSVEDFLAEGLADPRRREEPQFTTLASKLIDPDPNEQMRAGLAHMIGTDIVSEFAPPQLRQALAGMTEGQRHDTIVLIGDMAEAMTAIAADETSITGADVSQLRVRLGNLIGDENVEAAVEVALRRELQHREFMARFDDMGDDPLTSRAEGSDQLARLMEREISREELLGETEQVRASSFVHQGETSATTAINLNSKYLGGRVVPFQRTAAKGKPLPERSRAAINAAREATELTGLEHVVVRAGDAMVDAGATTAEIIQVANEVIAGQNTAWLKGQRSKRTRKGALEVLNRLDLVRLSDQALEQDALNVADGGFSVAQLRRVLRKPDADGAGVPRADQILMNDPRGKTVAVDLVAINRASVGRRNRRLFRETDEVQEAAPDLNRTGDLDTVGAAISQLMQQGYTLLSEQQMAQRVKEMRDTVRKTKNQAGGAALAAQLADFERRGSPRDINEFSIVNRYTSRKGMKFREVFSEQFHEQHGINASIENQRIDAAFLEELADAMRQEAARARREAETRAMQAEEEFSEQGALFGREEAGARQPNVVAAEIMAQALDIAAEGNLEAANAIVAGMSDAERAAAEQIYERVRKARSDVVPDAAVYVGDFQFGRTQAERRRKAHDRKLKEREKALRDRARRASVKEAEQVIADTLAKLPSAQRHRKRALNKAAEFFERIAAGEGNIVSQQIKKALAVDAEATQYQRSQAGFMRNVLMEMFVARAKVTSAVDRAALVTVMNPEMRKTQEQVIADLDLFAELIEHRLQIRFENNWARQQRTQRSDESATLREMRDAEEAFVKIISDDGYFIGAEANLNDESLYRNLSANVERRLTLFDYTLFQQAKQAAESDPEIMVSEGIRFENLAALNQSMHRYRQYQEAVSELALLMAHLGSFKKPVDLRKLVAKAAIDAELAIDAGRGKRRFFDRTKAILEQRVAEAERPPVPTPRNVARPRAVKKPAPRKGALDNPFSATKSGRVVRAPEKMKPSDYFTIPGESGVFLATAIGQGRKIAYRKADSFRAQIQARPIQEGTAAARAKPRRDALFVARTAQRINALEAQGKPNVAVKELQKLSLRYVNSVAAKASKKNRDQLRASFERQVRVELNSARNEAQTAEFEAQITEALNFPEGYPKPANLLRALGTAARTRRAVMQSSPGVEAQLRKMNVPPVHGPGRSIGIKMLQKTLKEFQNEINEALLTEAADTYREILTANDNAVAKAEYTEVKSEMDKWVSQRAEEGRMSEAQAIELSSLWDEIHEIQGMILAASDEQLRAQDMTFLRPLYERVEVVAEAYNSWLEQNGSFSMVPQMHRYLVEAFAEGRLYDKLPAEIFPVLAFMKSAIAEQVRAGHQRVEGMPSELFVNEKKVGARKEKLQNLGNEILRSYKLKVHVISTAADIRALLQQGLINRPTARALRKKFRNHTVFNEGSIWIEETSMMDQARREYKGAMRLENGDILTFISPYSSDSTAAWTLLHEVGHIIELEIFSRESEATQSAVFKEYEGWLETVGKTDAAEYGRNLSVKHKQGIIHAMAVAATPRDPNTLSKLSSRQLEYALGFREYFADRFANYATTSKKAKNLVDRFFDKVVAMWNKLRNAFRVQKEQFADTPVVDAWFENMLFNMSPFERARLMNEPRKPHWWQYVSENKLELFGGFSTLPSRTGITPVMSEGPLGENAAEFITYAMDPDGYDANYSIRHMIEMQLTAEERQTLARVFNQNKVRQQIIEFIADDPAWVLEVERHQDAFIATGYQMWAAGALEITPRAAGIFRSLDKFVSENIMGEVLKSDQAVEIMNAMQQGIIQQRQTVFQDPSVAKEGSNIQRGLYGLTHAELSFIETMYLNESNVPVAVVRDALKNVAKFKGWDDSQLRLLAQDISAGVFNKQLFRATRNEPTWALNPDSHFKLKKKLFDSRVANVARGVRGYTQGLGKIVSNLFFGRMMKARHSGNQGLIDGHNLLYHDVAGSRFSPSYDQTKTMGIAKFMSQYEAIIEPLTQKQRVAFRDAVFEGRPLKEMAGHDPAVVLAVKKYQKFMRDLRQHAVSAGLKMGDLSAGGDRIFVPWVFDEKAFGQRGKEFENFAAQEKYLKAWVGLMRERKFMYKADGERPTYTRKDVRAFIKHYIDGLANQDGFADSDVVVDPSKQTQPHARTMFKRELDFLWRLGNEADHKTIASFLNQNMNTTIATYINQVIKRSTFNEFFGDGKQADIEANIISQGGTQADVQMFRDSIDMQMGVYGLDLNGTLQRTIERIGKWFGKDWSNLDPATYRKIQGYVVTYQNVRLLAFAALTNVVDAAGIYVRSGELNMAFQGLKQGLAATRKNVTDADLKALKEQADMLGVSERIVVQDAIGQLYGGVHFTGTAAKINDMFFRYNGMIALNRWMRLSALGTARIYIKKHAALAKTGNKKSRRNLLDVGLRHEDILLDSTGDIRLLSDSEVEVLSEGMRPTEIQGKLLSEEQLRTAKKEVWEQQQNFREVLRDQRVKDALFRFVDEAVMRPSAMQRPGWGNDPNWGMFFHLKAFMYTYHERHLRRGLNKMLAEGDAGPIMMMGSFVGLMMAADMLRQFIQFGPDGDPRKKDWGFRDYLWEGTHRSGVLGVGTVLPDMAKTMELRSFQDPVTKYTSPAIEMGGPAVSQLDQLVRAAVGQRRRRAVIDALPANNVWRALDNWGREERSESRLQQTRRATAELEKILGEMHRPAPDRIKLSTSDRRRAEALLATDAVSRDVKLEAERRLRMAE